MKTWKGITASVISLLTLIAMIWAASSYWHGYTAAETIHEHDQAVEIKLAMDKSQLAIDQQRVKWLEERLFDMEQKYSCTEDQIRATCSSRIWRTYQKYIKEYTFLIEKINEQTSGN